MTALGFRQRLGSLAVLMSLGVLISASCVQAQPPAATVRNTPAQVSVASRASAVELASEGRFQSVLELLPDDAPETASLRQSLLGHLKQESDRKADIVAEYDETLDKLRTQLEEDNVDEALTSALQLRALRAPGKNVLAEPAVVEVIKQSQIAADEAAEEDRWLESLDLYRSLDALYDDQLTYRPQIERIGRRLRLMDTYAPKALHAIYVDRAKQLGLDEPPPLDQETAKWENRVEGVNRSMVRQALYQSAKGHITTSGYQPLLVDGIKALELFVDVEEIGDTFNSMRDEKLVERFKARLDELRVDMVNSQQQPNFLDAKRLIERVCDANEKTLQLPEPVVLFEFADGAMSGLDDFSGMIWPSDLSEFMRATTGKFTGVGIQISKSGGRLVVISPLENTPAQKAGVKPGDIIAQVDGHDTTNWSLDHAVRAITGPEGTFVNLGIERAGARKLVEVRIRRAEIILESVRGWEHRPEGGWNYIIDPDLKVGYIRLSQFINNSADEMDAAIESMQAQGGPRALILDLRGNPGGLLSSAIEVADRFIERGTIVSTVDARQVPTPPATARSHRTYDNFPVVVLINGGSASASEIVAGALQAHNRAVVVGDRSFGKGSVQDVFPLNTGRAHLKLTTQYYRLPDDTIIHRRPGAKTWGIEPDVPVYMTPAEMTAAFELRQEVDVLRGPDDPAPVNEDGEESPDDIEALVAKNIDPQLSTAVLIAKTQVMADKIKVARN